MENLNEMTSKEIAAKIEETKRLEELTALKATIDRWVEGRFEVRLESYCCSLYTPDGKLFAFVASEYEFSKWLRFHQIMNQPTEETLEDMRVSGGY